MATAQLKKNVKTQQKDASEGQIDTLIGALTYAKAIGDLCSTGENRLRWWKANRKKFSSIRAALLTWTPQQRRAYFEWAELRHLTKKVPNYDSASYYFGLVSNNLNNAITYLGDLQQPKELTNLIAAVRAFRKKMGNRTQLKRLMVAAEKRKKKGNALSHIPLTQTFLPANGYVEQYKAFKTALSETK